MLGGTQLSKTTLTNEWVNIGNKRFWYRINSTITDNTLEGRTVSSSSIYDNYGKVTQCSTNNNNGLETTLTNTTVRSVRLFLSNPPRPLLRKPDLANQPMP